VVWVQQGNIKGPSTELSLPSYAGSRLNQFDPRHGTYNFKHSNTKRIRNALRKVQFGTGVCHIANISDSSSSGFIGGQSAAGYDLLGAWPMTMRDVLNRELGITPGGTGIVPAAQWPTNDSDPKWALGGRWSFAGTVTNGGGYMTLAAGGYAGFYSDQVGTQVDVYYYNSSGAFTVSIDGAAAVAPPRTGGLTLNKYTVTGLAEGVHSILISATATAYMAGVQVSTPTKGLHVHNLGIYGEKGYVWDTATDITLAAPARLALLDSIGATITDLLVLKIGANDRTAYLAATNPTYTPQQMVDAIKATYRSLRNKARWVGSDVLIILQNNTDDLYSAAFYDLADEFDCPLLDTRYLFTSPTQAQADGLITPLDNVHYNARGQKQMGLMAAAPFVDMLESPIPQQGIGPVSRPRPDLISGLKFPLFIAHRGGHGIHGEHSQEAYQWAADQGFAIEPDVQLLSDGGMACIHDATTTRTMQQIEGTTQSTVSAITTRDWQKNYRILPELAGGDYERPATFDWVLDTFGGTTLIVPEIKTNAARVPLLNAIVARGLERAVLVQSFDIADCLATLQRGIEACLLNPTQTAAVLTAAGIKYVGCPTSATNAYLDTLVAAGIKVFLYTVNSRATVDTYVSGNRGHGFFSDDPEWVSGRGSRSYVDPFARRYPWQHVVVPANGFRENLIFKGGGLGQRIVTTGNNIVGTPQDWCPPIVSGKVNIYYEVEFGDVATAQTRWVGLAFGKFATTDDPFVDGATVGQTAIHALVRRDGTLDLYTLADNGAAVQVGTFAGAVLSAAGQSNGPWRFKFTRDAAGITLKNLNNGQSVTYANAALVWANSRFQFNFNGTEATVRNVRVEEIP
jgi:glycerophosphoryl diester phosphodiesterase